MYAEHLYAPHPEHDRPDISIMALIGHNLAGDAWQNGHRPGYQVQAAAQIQSAVRKALWYRAGAGIRTLADDQVTDCYGYTIVGSECLEAAGIPHVINYVNGHAFLGQPETVGDKDRLRLLDMLNPLFNQDMTSTLKDTPAKLYDSIAARGRADTQIDTRRVAHNINYDLPELSPNYPWILRGNDGSPRDSRTFSPKRHEHMMVMSAFAPSVGRTVLQQYARFSDMTEAGDPFAARLALSTIARYVPDIDANGDHETIRRHVYQLCQRQAPVHFVADSIDYYCSSFVNSDDPRLFELEADLHAIAAMAQHEPWFSANARRLYTMAAEQTNQGWYRRRIRGKLGTLAVRT